MNFNARSWTVDQDRDRIEATALAGRERTIADVRNRDSNRESATEAANRSSFPGGLH
jgi:hypothetical protein